MISCPRCGNLNPDGSPICFRCRTQLRAVRASAPELVTHALEPVLAAVSAPLEEFAVGAMVDGRYLVHRLIGRGGMGAVYEATDLRLRRRTALKALHTELLSHPTARSRMEVEARALAAIQHPNVVEIRNTFEHGAVLVLELELVTGGTLAHRIAGRADTIDTIVQLSVTVLSGLGAIHAAGLVHRDVKPANVLLTETGVPKIADLGVAHELGVRGKTKTGTRLGTPAYMSPEQVRGLPVDVRSDIYATGILLYEMFTGSVPFRDNSEYEVMEAHVRRAPDLEELRRVVPEALVLAVAKALEKAPEARWASALEFAGALQQASKSGASHARDAALPSATPCPTAGPRQPTPPEPPVRAVARPSRVGKLATSLAILGALVAAGGMGGLALLFLRSPPEKPFDSGVATGVDVALSAPPVIALPTPPPVWTLRHSCETPELTITRLSIVDGETVVAMRYVNSRGTPRRIGTAPPESADAFRIEDRTRTRQAPLRRSMNIGVVPDWNTVDPGSALEFTLYFAAIDPSWSPLVIREGDGSERGKESLWVCRDVVLE